MRPRTLLAVLVLLGPYGLEDLRHEPGVDLIDGQIADYGINIRRQRCASLLPVSALRHPAS
jgi:hypothetical protein